MTANNATSAGVTSTVPARSAVFVDRDHTLIEDPGYIHDPAQVRLLDGVPEAVARLRSAGYPVVVLTNQSGVARGLITEDQLAAIHQRLQDLLQAQGTGVDAIYYCPFLDGPEAVRASYRRASELRKPQPGMFHLAASEMNLDLARSWMIGDSQRDVEAGRAACCKTILLDRNGESPSSSADHVSPDLTAAVEHILAAAVDAEQNHAPVLSPDPKSGRDPQGSAGSVAPSVPATPMPPAEQPGPEPAPRDRAVMDEAKSEQGIKQRAPEPEPAEKPGDLGRVELLLDQIIEELRMTRREQQHEDFSIAKLAGAVAQAFALCAIGWGLYAWMNAGTSPSGWHTPTVSLLTAIAFQVMALTFFAASSRR